MNKCFEEIKYLLYLDNELGKDEREAVDQHLQVCRKCKKYIDKEIDNNLKIAESFNSGHKPEDLYQKISEKVYPQKKLPKIFFKWALTAATAVFIILIVNTFIFRKKVFFKETPPQELQVLISSAYIEGQLAKPHLFISGDADKKYFWLEKINKNEENEDAEKN